MRVYKILILLVLSSCSCNAQIYQELEGTWLPEKYIEAIVKNDTINAHKFQLPVEVIQIIETDTRKFARDYSSDLNNRDTINVDDFILIKTYKSEFNGYTIETVKHRNGLKYKLPSFYSGLNMMQVSNDVMKQYENADIYLSRVGKKMALEVIGKTNKHTVYFVNSFRDYKFINFEEATSYIRNLRAR